MATIVADIPGAVQRGLQFQQAAQLRPGALQSQQFGLQRQEQQLQTGALQQQQIQQGIETEAQRAKSQNLFNTVARLRTLPDAQKGAFLEQNIIDIESRPDGDATESRQALALTQQGNFSELNEGLDNLFQAGVNTGFLQAEPVEKGVTLSPGQKRFVGGKVVAEVAPLPTKATAPTEQAVIPDVLLQGLDPDIASKGAAAFTAAGGGKDGLTAFQKIVDKGTEQQRRAASPEILKASFPKASQAETVQLQAAMDAAKTTEAGLKAAGKVREEQRRNVKGKKFQNRAIELLDNILGSDELEDVIGSIEGAIDFRLFSDEESQVISDIEEAGNILTAGNLSLMSGVLSETDIKIIASLAGGALNRKRSEKRFRADVTKLRDKLAREQVVTADDTAAARGTGDLQEGVIIRNPQTGQRLQLVNGQFVEVQ